MQHTPQNVNALHKAEQELAGFNTKLAVTLTRSVGTMSTAYLFALLALIGLLGIMGILSPIAVVLVTWFSQTFLQLVFLPILSVGQNVLSRHQELQADEQYNTTTKTYHDTEQIVQHLEAQDEKILLILTKLEQRNSVLHIETGALTQEHRDQLRGNT